MSEPIDSSVFELLGRAIFQAQCLEETLVTQNLLLGSNPDALDPQAVAVLEEKLKKKPLGPLLKDWTKFIPHNGSLFSFLQDVVSERNLLAHRLFRGGRFKTTEDYTNEILNITARLRSAQMLVYGNNPNLTKQLDEEWWGITPEDTEP